MGNYKAKLESWANINSYTYNLKGLAKMLSLLKSEFKKNFKNLKFEEIELSPHNYINNQGQLEKRPLGKMLVIRKVKPDAKLRILLGGHMDTVYPEDHHFQRCRDLDSNILNGPGVADLKGGLIVLIEALRRFEASPHSSRISWTVFLNPDEELGSPGSAPELAKLAREHDIGLVYEPSLADGSLAYKRMGTGNFTVVARGKAAHVGRDFAAGRNALIAVSDLALELHALNNKLKDNNIILNVGNIISEGPLNVVPDLAVLRLNIRLADNKTEALALEEIKKLVTATATKHGIEMNFDGYISSKAKIPDARLEKLYTQIQECARKLGLELKLRDTGGCCDGNKLWTEGLANIDTLGVRGGNIHSDAEFVLLDSIEERINLSHKFLEELSQNL